MMRLTYFVHIDVDETNIPADVIHEIHTEAEPHDRDWSAMVRRYVGDALSDAASNLGGALPEGFAARIDDVPEVDRVRL